MILVAQTTCNLNGDNHAIWHVNIRKTSQNSHWLTYLDGAENKFLNVFLLKYTE